MAGYLPSAPVNLSAELTDQGASCAVITAPSGGGTGQTSFTTRRRIVEVIAKTTTGGTPETFDLTNDGGSFAGSGVETIGGANNSIVRASTIIEANSIVEIGDLVVADLGGTTQTAEFYIFHVPA